jgi:predicted MarR family transcription regulator
MVLWICKGIQAIVSKKKKAIKDIQQQIKRTDIPLDQQYSLKILLNYNVHISHMSSKEKEQYKKNK